MSKFGNRPTNVTGPLGTTDEPQLRTHEGGRAFAPDAKSELFLLAATNMVSEATFYETAADRDGRFEKLIHDVVAEDADWVARFTGFLRTGLLMRSASVVLAAEYVKAGGPNGRRVVDAALQRPDEPGEMLAYWRSRHGRSLPAAIQRGVADAVRRLYTERSVLKWDGNGNAWRFADVIETIHPKPVAPWQSALFKYLLDGRHHKDAAINQHGDTQLPTLTADLALRAMPEADRRAALGGDLFVTAGWSWERLSGWLPGGMDAQAWEAVIPTMGVMALLRNLRNFDEATISETAIDRVIGQITDPAQVERARLFPYQVWAAYKNAPSDDWKRALAKTLDLACRNIPEMQGGTLILIDTSGSMDATVSGKSTMTRLEVAALMAMATARRSADVDVVIFGQESSLENQPAGTSVLQGVQNIVRCEGKVGHATMGHTAMRRWFNPAKHRRVIMFTDDQQHDSGIDVSMIPLIYTYDLAGYRPQSLPNGDRGRYVMGGFSDAGFRLAPMLEAAGDKTWPF